MDCVELRRDVQGDRSRSNITQRGSSKLFMTSPSWPVRMSFTVPSSSVALNRREIAFQAPGPVHSSGDADLILFFGTSPGHANWPKIALERLRPDVASKALITGNLACRLATNGASPARGCGRPLHLCSRV